MNSYLKKFCFSCLILVCLTYHGSPLAQPIEPTAATREKPSPSPLIVACSPDKPIVYPDEAIRVRAYANSPVGTPLQYAWAVPVGRINGQGAEISWDFTAVALGDYKAKLTVKEAGGGVTDCSIRIVVVARPPPERGRETGRAFLLSRKVEDAGYGLYSYLLLGSRPTTASRERYLKAIEEYLRFPDIARLVENLPRRTLNTTYLPLQTDLGPEIKQQLADEHYTEVAEWVLKQYDYERARVLLQALPGDLRDGPYIVSFLKPPRWDGSPPSRPYLYQDQSSVPPHLVSLWAKEFLNQAAQENFSQERTAVQLALKLRTAVGILALALPDPPKNLAHWIVWVP